MQPKTLELSTLRKTWIFDLDGTLVVHNGYKTGEDQLLPGVKEFFDKLPEEDYVLILTAREEKVRKRTESFLQDNHIRYDQILFQMPMGERILFNDNKPSGLQMSYAVACQRDEGLACFKVIIDESL